MESYFQKDIEKIFSKWEKNSDAIYYVHPTSKIRRNESGNSPVAASSLKLRIIDVTSNEAFKNATTTIEGDDVHFVATDIKNFTDHLSAAKTLETLKEFVGIPRTERNPKPYIMQCCAEICENFVSLKDGVRNEAAVRYAYANPIVKVLYRYFHYKLDFEETEPVSGPLLTSQGSKYDYVVWRLMVSSSSTSEEVPVVVLETKHETSVRDKAVAQAIGYYARAKKNYTGTGFALILNEFNSHITVRFILFPYTSGDDSFGVQSFGVQALLLPSCTYTHDDFLDGEIIKMLLGICMKIELFTLRCPNFLEIVVPINLIGVYSKEAMERKGYEQTITKLKEELARQKQVMEEELARQKEEFVKLQKKFELLQSRELQPPASKMIRLEESET